MTFRQLFNKNSVFIFMFVFLIACGSNKSKNFIDENTDVSSSNEEDNVVNVQELPQAVVKVLPLGDSITQGGSGFVSYRRDLWFLLKNAGYIIDFVGSQSEYHGEVTDNLKDFDQDHEGHWAWEAGELDSRLEDWLDDYQADIVLLHAGTNDFDRGQSNGSTIQELTSIIDKLRKNNSAVIILLAKIIPMKSKDTRAINERIEVLAEAESTKKSPIVLVDQHEGYEPLVDNHDNYHPNTLGESKIAKKWFENLVPFLEK